MANFSEVGKESIQDIIALTPAQEGMLSHYLHRPEDWAFSERLCVRLKGVVDWECFAEAWNHVTGENEALRTVFRWENVPQPLQLALKHHQPELVFLNEGDRLPDWFADLRHVPFRISLRKTGERSFAMRLDYHHIVLDGWSSGIVLQEFFEAYDALLEGRQPAAGSKPPFKEYVRFLKEQDTQEQENFWKGYLDGVGSSVNIRRKSKHSIRPDFSSFSFHRDLELAIHRFNRQNKTTTAALLYAAWGILLAELHHTSDVWFDTTVSGRSASIEGIDRMTGLLINTLPLRMTVGEDDTLRKTVLHTNNFLTRRQPFETTSRQIINSLMEERALDGLFDSLLVLENYPLDKKLNDPQRELWIESYDIIEKTRYDLTLIIEADEGIDVGITFNALLFSPEEIAVLAARFEALTAAIVAEPEAQAQRLLTDTEGLDDIIAKLRQLAQEESLDAQAFYVAPRDRLEEELVRIWGDVLSEDDADIGIDHDFFAFGGHSLRASALANSVKKRLDVKLPLPEIFRNPTIRQLAAFIGGQVPKTPKTEDDHSLQPAPHQDAYPASSAQQRLFFLWQMDPRSIAYNGPVKITLQGDLDRQHLQRAFATLIQRHETLRTSFELKEGKPAQRIHDTVEFQIEALDIDNFIRPFDMSRAPLIRVGLRTIEDSHTLMVDIHHIVCDGTSRDIIVEDFAALLQGRTLSPLTYQFKDFCDWQEKQVNQNNWQKERDYWLGQYTPLPEPLDLPLDFPRPVKQSHEGKRRRFSMPADQSRQLDQLQKRFGLTRFMACHAILSLLLSTYCRSDDVVVGTAIAGRHHSELDDTVGLFMETLALRSAPAKDKTLSVFLTEMRRLTLDAFENQRYPFRQILKDLNVDPGQSRSPLFDVMLIVQNHQRRRLQLPGLEIEVEDVDAGVAKVDLTWEVYDEPDGVEVELEYNTQLLKTETVERMWKHWLYVLDQAADTPASSIGSLELATDDEKRQILNNFNDGSANAFVALPVPEQLLRTVDKIKDTISLVGKPDQWLSYSALFQRASALAEELGAYGVKEGDLVALMNERSPETIIAIVGIMLAGAAYVPLDPSYPEERVSYILSDSRASFMVVDEENLSRVPDSVQAMLVPGICVCEGEDDLENLDQKAIDASSPAYVIYTSGSTGRPKGVVVEHRNLASYIAAFRFRYPITADDIVMQQASVTFDASSEEIWPAILSGGRVVIAGKEEVQDVALLADRISRHCATIIDCSPLLLGELNRRPQHELRSLRLMINGGDVLKREYINALLKTGHVINTYGPTETTICAAYYNCGNDVADPIPIGSPVPGYGVVILDEAGHLQPVGIPGELCIAGPGVTRGYLNRPDLTDDKFIETEIFEDSDGPLRMYRSGDLACWRSDGQIRFLGRIDRQVKIRGYRIELEEIENAILSEADIAAAAVIPRCDEGRESFLCAYIVGAGEEEADILQLRSSLSQQLPNYMVPAYFVAMDTLPLTASGKVDARLLPKPGRQDLYSSREFIGPRDQGERQIAAILQDLLKIEAIGIHDDFFELGGDSILANRTIARIREETGGEISLRTFFQTPTVEGLAKAVRGAVDERISIPRASRDREIPLSYPQERLWFLQQLDGDNRAYIIPRALRLKGRLDPALFERSLTEIVRRHEILRTAFITVEGRPIQVVKPPFAFKIPVIDFTGKTHKEQREAIDHFIVDEGNRPFDFETGPLIRMHLLKMAENEHILVSVEHHLIHDGWTQGVLLREFFTMYQALLENKPSPLAELPIQYADYAVWQRSYMAGERLERYVNFWKQKLNGLAPLLELPLDSPRPPALSGRGKMKRLVIPSSLASGLYRFGKEQGSTLFMTMLAVFKVLLYRYSGCEDLVVGSGIANRRYKELEGMLGMVINTLALRTTIEGSMSFADCVLAVKETALEAYEYEEAPFDKVVEAVSPERSLSYMPVFQVMFSFMDTPTERLSLPGLEFEVVDSHNQSSKFDINLVVIPPREGDELEGEILLDWEYNTDLFRSCTMKAMMRRFKKLLDYCVRHPEVLVNHLPLLEEDEKQELLTTFNDTTVDYPLEFSIPDLFAREAARAPSRVSLIEGDHSITYHELELRAGALAAKLTSFGVKREEPVAIMAQRSITMIVGVSGILTAGAAYLPIARDFPLERKKYMIEDASARLLLHDGDGDNLPGCRSLFLEEPLKESLGKSQLDNKKIAGLSGDSLAYIMYTSGSTGKPKGVMVTHRNVVRLVKPLSFVDVDVSDCVLPTGPLEFDASTFEIWGGLLNRIPLAFVPKETIIDASRLKTAIRQFGVTTMWMTVALFNQMLEMDIEVFGSLRHILVGGDALSPPHINRLRERFPQLFIMNGYGPTENTTFSTTFCVDRDYSSNIPIGRPIANSSAFILDPWRNPQPIGVPGELWVGGDGVARGYLNAPQLTAEKFVVLGGRRLYRTGDRARFLDGGVIEFLGRMDRQVKIRGFRIELGEIENQLLLHERVTEAVVLAVGEGGKDKTLVAYVVDSVDGADSVDALADELEGCLGRVLPAFMVPSAFVVLKKMPLTANGKVDRRALPRPVMPVVMREDIPSSWVEARLAKVWSGVLNISVEQIGRSADFFKSGGHSLKAANLAAAIHKEFSVKLPLQDIFQYSSLREMAQQIAAAGSDVFIEVPPAEKKDYYPLSSAQKRLFIIQQLDPTSTVYNIPLAMSVGDAISRDRLEEILKELVQRHESLRTSFHSVQGQTVQRIHERADLELQDEPEDINDFIRPFDLAQAPLFRAALIDSKNTNSKSLFLMDMHHIIGDGVSMAILEEDFKRLAADESLTPLKLHYRDYAEWQHYFRKNELLEKQERFWLWLLEEPLPVLELPTDFSRPIKQDFVGDRIWFDVDETLTGRIRQLALNMGATLYMALLSIFYILLSRLSGQEDIIIGTPVAARRHSDFQNIVGIFINTLVLRQQPSDHLSFEEFLMSVKETTLHAFENQEYPFDELVSKVAAQNDPSRNPVFDVMFALENTRENKGLYKTEGTDESLVHRPVSRFDMTWNCRETNGRLRFTVEFRTGLLRQETVRRWTGYFPRIVEQVCDTPGEPIHTIELMSVDERRRVIDEFNGTSVDYPSNSSITELFSLQAKDTPGAIAVISGEQQLSYDALGYLSAEAAGKLAARGVRWEAAIGIEMDRCIEMIVAMMGILEVGAAYLPINTGLPQNRKQQLMDDTNVEVVLTESDFDSGMLAGEPSAGTYRHEPEASTLAYILYTSGSTGIPKGVMVEHRSVVRLVKQTNYIEFAAGERLLQTGALEFDASTFEIWGSLLNGMSLVLVDKSDILVASNLKRALHRYDVGVMWLTSPLFNQLLEADQEIFRHLKWLLVGGDVLSPPHIRKVMGEYPELRVINGYGPTENTTFSTTHRIELPVEGPVPIGRPIANSTAYVLDRRGKPQPIGVFGELWLGGDGVARGYLNRPELTEEKYVDFGAPYGRLYRSGDLARYNSDGIIEFGGRIDQQVKIRGFRVEPEEIEAVLRLHQDINDVVLEPIRDHGGELCLCAYFASSTELDDRELRKFLSGRLPHYMVPDYFTRLDALPLTSSGKVDRKKLGPVIGGLISGKDIQALPSTRYERVIANVWKELLGLEKIGIDDNFFELGGNSLKIVKVNHKMNEELGLDVPVVKLFEFPTIRLLASYCSGRGSEVENVEEEMNSALKIERVGRTAARRRRMMEVEDE